MSDVGSLDVGGFQGTVSSNPDWKEGCSVIDLTDESGMQFIAELPAPASGNASVSAKDFIQFSFSITSSYAAERVYRLFLSHADWFWIPVVDDQKPVGLISRHALIEKFSFRYSHDLFSRKPIGQFMNSDPLIVDARLTVDDLTRCFLERGLKRDNDCFLVTDGGRYLGLGTVHAWMRELARREEALLYHRANHDPLTGLANRAHFYRALEESVRSGQGSGEKVGLLYVDLDRFKFINDSWGHGAGDALLLDISRRLSSLMGPGEVGARLGGDEFALILPGIPDRRTLSERKTVLDRMFGTPFHYKGNLIPVGASVGTALWPDDSSDPESLVHAADRDMYRTKRVRKRVDLPGEGWGVFPGAADRTLEGSWSLPDYERVFVELGPDGSVRSVAGPGVERLFGSGPVGADAFRNGVEQTGIELSSILSCFTASEYESGGPFFFPAADGKTLPIYWVSRQSGPADEASPSIRVAFLVAEGVLDIAVELERRKTLDALTGLINRSTLYEHLDRVLDSEEGGGSLALFLIDLDRFKTVNDTYGPIVGDQILIMVGKRLRSWFRPEDTVARMGGDEFAILLEGSIPPDALKERLDELIRALSHPFPLPDGDIVVTPSIGVSFAPLDGRDKGTLLKNADSALYMAKEKGGNRYCFYQGTMNALARDRLKLETRLRGALDRSEFRVFYQPIVSVPGREVVGMEALVRWQSPEFGLVGPDRFIPLAEETGLIVPIGEWVLKTALAQAVRWGGDIDASFWITVNVSPRQIKEPDFHKMLERCLQETGADPRHLILELTENALMQQADSVIDVLSRIKDRGVSIAIDDFGTGYSSLNYLKRFPADIIKIDKSFVSEVTQNTEDAAITRAITHLVHSLGRKVCAEGVETQEQWEFLSGIGCDRAQGFLVSRPLESDHFHSLYLKTRPEPPASS